MVLYLFINYYCDVIDTVEGIVALCKQENSDKKNYSAQISWLLIF